MTSPVVTVIIVTYNSASTIEPCLTMLAAALDALGTPAEVIVWDNNSRDATIACIEQHPLSKADGFTLVASTENPGFGGANNAAAERATAPTLLLLNPDAFLEDPSAIVRLLEVRRTNDAAILGPFLANADGSHQVGDAGYAETLRVAILWSTGLNMLPGVPGLFLSRAYSADTKPFSVDWICGACLMIDRALFERLAGFDRTIFLYGEDIDLGLRAKSLGAKIQYVPSIRVRHVQGVSLGSERASTTWLESRFVLFERVNRSSVRRRLFAAVLMYGFGWRWAVYRVTERLFPRRRVSRMALKMKAYFIFSSSRLLTTEDPKRRVDA